MLGDAAACGACTQEDNFLIAELAACRTARGNQRPHCHCRSALNVIVERADLIAVAVQQRHGVFLREVFELQQHVRPAVLHGLDEIINKLIVLVVGNARVTPAHVQRIVQQLLVVGPHVQHHRQGVGRADPTAGGIQRELTDGDPHPTNALVAKAQNTFAIGYHDHLDVVIRHVLQNVVHVVTVLIGDEHAPGTSVDL